MHRILVALALSAAGVAQAATVSVYTDLAAWTAALSSPAQLQDFSGYANGTDLTGVQVLPGLTLGGNLGPLEVFGAQKTASAFGAARSAGNAYFEGRIRHSGKCCCATPTPAAT